MKRLIALICAVSAVLLLATACSGGSIVGKWNLVEGDGGSYGKYLEFNEDGSMSYDYSALLNEDQALDPAEYEQAANMLKQFIVNAYAVDTDRKIIRISSASLFAEEPDLQEYEYSLSGDTLILNGWKYQRDTGK